MATFPNPANLDVVAICNWMFIDHSVIFPVPHLKLLDVNETLPSNSKTFLHIIGSDHLALVGLPDVMCLESTGAKHGEGNATKATDFPCP